MRRLQTAIALVLATTALACGPTNNGKSQNASTNSQNGSTNGPNGVTGGDNVSPNNVSPNGATNNPANNATTGPNSQTTQNNQNPACALPTPFDEGVSYTDEVRVEPGEDLQAALAAATPGTRITLGAGQHTGGVSASGLQGTEDAPIALVGEDGAVISGGTSGMQLSDPAYVVIENVTFEGASANGLNIDDGGDYSTPAHHVILRGVEVSDVGDGGNQDCIKLSGLDDFRIELTTVSGCSGQAIDMVGCHDGIITSNTVRDTPGAGVQAKGGSADVLVHRNWFQDVAGRGVNAGGSTGLEYFRPIDAPHEGARIQVYANVFVDVGASSGAPVAYVGCDACEFTNNTIVRPLTWVARILQETTDARFVPSRDGVFANNVVVLQSDVVRSIVNVGPNTAPETFTFRNNLWWDLDDANWGGPSLGGGVPAEQNGMVGDPGFDASGSDFSVAAGSPAATLGADAPAVPDYSGECFGDPPSAGAFQAQ
jgi:hypothetical protein